MPLSEADALTFLTSLPARADRFACQEAGEAAPAVPGEWIFFSREQVTFYVPHRYKKERRWNKIIEKGLHWQLKANREE